MKPPKPFPVLHYNELGRRLRMPAVSLRIQALRRAVELASQELRLLENVLLGKGRAS